MPARPPYARKTDAGVAKFGTLRTPMRSHSYSLVGQMRPIQLFAPDGRRLLLIRTPNSCHCFKTTLLEATDRTASRANDPRPAGVLRPCALALLSRGRRRHHRSVSTGNRRLFSGSAAHTTHGSSPTPHAVARVDPFRPLRETQSPLLWCSEVRRRGPLGQWNRPAIENGPREAASLPIVTSGNSRSDPQSNHYHS